MTDDQIKKLAESYAKWENEFVPPCMDSKPLLKESAESAYAVIEWLSKTHCIVEKEKVKKLYEDIEADRMALDPPYFYVADGALSEMEDIFDKELFNGKEE